MHYFQNSKARAVRSVRKPFGPSRGLSGLGEVGPSEADIRSQINVASAVTYNASSSVKNQWAVAATAGGLRANSEAIAIEVAMFQYAVGASMDGKLGPGTLTSLRSFQQKDYYAEASRNPRLAYGISLAQHIVIGTSEAKWALAAKYNKEEAARGQFSLVGSYYKGADDPKLASEVALVQAAHGVAADGRMNAETISLFKRLVREGGKEGFLLSGSFRFPGVEPVVTPPPGAEPVKKDPVKKDPVKKDPVAKTCPEGQSLVGGVCKRKKLATKQKPVAESNTGMVVGLLAAAAGAYYLTQS
jgi:hypothetical protein